ncbi:MAG: pilus assembly protein [Planctomycetota bacterium]|nr:pilus assembly protein [Planctomycetota bacterium]
MSLQERLPVQFVRRRAHSGAVTLELIVSLLVLFIALFVVVEFGLAMANLQHLARASRDGAKIASETAGLAPATTAATASTIRAAIDRRLESAGFGANATLGVTLRHTLGAGDVATDGTCSDPISPPLATDMVRVTVCVQLTKLTPNLLSPFGYDITSETAEHTTTFDYEL